MYTGSAVFILLLLPLSALSISCYEGIDDSKTVDTALILQVQGNTDELEFCDTCGIRKVYHDEGKDIIYEAKCLPPDPQEPCKVNDVYQQYDGTRHQYVKCCYTEGCNSLPFVVDKILMPPDSEKMSASPVVSESTPSNTDSARDKTHALQGKNDSTQTKTESAQRKTDITKTKSPSDGSTKSKTGPIQSKRGSTASTASVVDKPLKCYYGNEMLGFSEITELTDDKAPAGVTSAVGLCTRCAVEVVSSAKLQSKQLSVSTCLAAGDDSLCNGQPASRTIHMCCSTNLCNKQGT